MVHVLESYLNFITGFFGTPHLSEDWSEALDIYISELKELVTSVVYR
jgi:hypothetical protein